MRETAARPVDWPIFAAVAIRARCASQITNGIKRLRATLQVPLRAGAQNMRRQKRADFFEEIERIEQVLNQLLEAEEDAFRRMMEAPTGPAKGAALSSYRRAAGAQKKAVDRRQKFLEKNRP
jgi:hypothetical protein